MQLHIRYLLSLEDSERVRAACRTYLQTCLIYFFPERSDLVKQLEQTARDLGLSLQPPQLSWKYAWIRSLFGWKSAKFVQAILPRLKWRVQKSWDKALFKIEGPEPLGPFEG
jgi:hypothetical protein